MTKLREGVNIISILFIVYRMDNIEQLAEKLIKIYPLECTKYAPKHYQVDGKWQMDQIKQLVVNHLPTLDVDLDGDLKEIVDTLSEDMFNSYIISKSAYVQTQDPYIRHMEMWGF